MTSEVMAAAAAMEGSGAAITGQGRPATRVVTFDPRPAIAEAIDEEIEAKGAGIAGCVYDARQRRHLAWARRVFGAVPGVDVMSVKTRALRFLEEAVELYQAACHAENPFGSPGVSREKAIDLVEYVFSRPPGVVDQEVGDCAITLLSLCETAGTSFDACERAGARRLADVDVEKLRAKQLRKIAAGLGF